MTEDLWTAELLSTHNTVLCPQPKCPQICLIDCVTVAGFEAGSPVILHDVPRSFQLFPGQQEISGISNCEEVPGSA